MLELKEGNISEITDTGDFNPVLNFFVCSDIHIKKTGDIRCGRVARMMRIAREASADYGGVDAFLFAGDITDSGTRSQFRAFSSLVKRESPGAQILAVTAAYHDNGRFRRKDGNKYFRTLFGMPGDFHTVIHGFHFIGISTCDTPGVYYCEAQREWLDSQLASATAQNPGRPVFVMHHEHVKDTVYGSSDIDGWGTDYFRDIFNRYHEVIHFSGHSHYPLNDPRSVWQGDFTAVGTGSMNYAEFTVDGVRKIHPAGCKRINQVWSVRVDAKYRVLLRGIDCITRTVLCEYLLTPPFYTQDCSYPEKMKNLFPAPDFPRDNTASVFETERSVTVTFPVSDSLYESPCFLYRVFLNDENGKTIDSAYVLNEYWRKSRKRFYTVRFKNPGCIYGISVCAENSFGKRSGYMKIKANNK